MDWPVMHAWPIEKAVSPELGYRRVMTATPPMLLLEIRVAIPCGAVRWELHTGGPTALP